MEHVTSILYGLIPSGALIGAAVLMAVCVRLPTLPRISLMVMLLGLALLWPLTRADLLVGGILGIPAVIALLSVAVLGLACICWGVFLLIKRDRRALSSILVGVVLVASIPAAPAAFLWLDFEIRRPFREQVALRLQRSTPPSGAQVITPLPRGAGWLSWNAEVVVSHRDADIAVLFWNTQGVGDGSGDVFSSSGSYWPDWSNTGEYGPVSGHWRSFFVE